MGDEIIFPPPIDSPPPTPRSGPISNIPSHGYQHVINKAKPFPWKEAFFMLLLCDLIIFFTMASIKLYRCFSSTPTSHEDDVER